MDTIKFTFSETDEEVLFAVLGSIEYEGETYLLVVDKEELNDENMTAYILKALEEDGEEIVYEIVDDDEELDAVTGLFDEVLENYDIDYEDDSNDKE